MVPGAPNPERSVFEPSGRTGRGSPSVGQSLVFLDFRFELRGDLRDRRARDPLGGALGGGLQNLAPPFLSISVQGGAGPPRGDPAIPFVVHFDDGGAAAP